MQLGDGGRWATPAAENNHRQPLLRSRIEVRNLSCCCNSHSSCSRVCVQVDKTKQEVGDDVTLFIFSSLPFFITTTGDVNSPKSWRSSWFNYRVSSPSLSTSSSSRYTWIINNASLYSDKTPSWVSSNDTSHTNPSLSYSFWVSRQRSFSRCIFTLKWIAVTMTVANYAATLCTL